MNQHGSFYDLNIEGSENTWTNRLPYWTPVSED